MTDRKVYETVIARNRNNVVNIKQHYASAPCYYTFMLSILPLTTIDIPHSAWNITVYAWDFF